MFSRDHEISFEAYDQQFGSIPDPDFELDMAISRWLFPYQLSGKMKAAYEKRIRSRFRPACRKLMTGAWNLAGRAPALAPAFLQLGKMDRFLLKELKEEAAAMGQLELAGMLIRLEYDMSGTAVQQEKHFQQKEQFRQKEQAQQFQQMEQFRQMLRIGDTCLTMHRPDLAEISLRYSISYPADKIFHGIQPGHDPALYYLHRLLHRNLGHVEYCSYYEGEADRISLACDITVSYYMDLIFDPVDQARQERQKIYEAILFAWPLPKKIH